MSVLEDLDDFGPDAQPGATPDAATARAYTRRLTTQHYENFPVLSLAVPHRLRQHFANVYAYCRWSDDLADEVGDTKRSLTLLDWWETELISCYAGQPQHPVMIALAETIEEFAIPRKPFSDLLVAFRRDQRQQRYRTFAELRDYCRYSADPVGQLVLYLCRLYDERRVALSDNVCTGLQLANFWQDVSRDLDKGRVYLPAEDMCQFGVAETEVLQRQFSPQFARLLAFQVDRAEEHLRTGLPLVKEMPGRLRIVIAAFVYGGLAILHKIRAGGFDVFARRPKLNKADLLGVLLRSATRLAH